jgi:hypothetical protein
MPATPIHTRPAALLLLLTLAAPLALTAQVRSARDPHIDALLAQVSAEQIGRGVAQLVSFGTRNTNSTQDDPQRGIGAARDWIHAELQRIAKACGECLQVADQSFDQGVMARVPHPIVITNVVATLPGSSDPDRVYVVSAHYDSMCSDPADAACDAPGANDDASGTAAVIEMARVMTRQRYAATIVFMAVAGEEQGLLGATHFAEAARGQAMAIHAMFTNDIIGGATAFKDRADRNSVRVFAEGVPSNETEAQARLRRSVGGENDSPARQLARFVHDTAALYTPHFKVNVIYRRDRFLRGGDHIPFLERGFAAVRFTEPHEDYTHQHQNVRTQDGVVYGDTLPFVDFDYIADVTRVNVATLASLARAPAAPADVHIITTRLTNDTELTWRASTDADLAGYEIVWRETTAPNWSDALFVGNVTEHTMHDLSKDNYFFGVRTIDKEGHRSPVAFPVPAG